jgi:hypothetical protein
MKDQQDSKFVEVLFSSPEGLYEFSMLITASEAKTAETAKAAAIAIILKSLETVEVLGLFADGNPDLF